MTSHQTSDVNRTQRHLLGPFYNNVFHSQAIPKIPNKTKFNMIVYYILAYMMLYDQIAK